MCATFLLTRVVALRPQKKVHQNHLSMLRGKHIAIIQRTAISRFSIQHGLFKRQGKGASPRVMTVAVKVAICLEPMP
jgi:hypothetical protein